MGLVLDVFDTVFSFAQSIAFKGKTSFLGMDNVTRVLYEIENENMNHIFFRV